MASSAKYFCVFLLTLLSPIHIHARESQFFNKVQTSNNNDAVKETEVPNKKEPLSKQEQEPDFFPQTGSGYGLYGHESSQLPPTTTSANGEPYKTTTNIPHKTESSVPFNKPGLPENYNPVAYVTKPQGTNDATLPKNYNTGAYVTQPQGMNDAHLPKNYNTEAYVTQPQGMSDTRFMDRGYTTTSTNGFPYKSTANIPYRAESEEPFNKAGLPENYNPVAKPQGMNDAALPKNYNTEAYVTQPQGMNDRGYTTTTRSNSYNGQKQGMSDTRFLQNGKYYYDINTEKSTGNPYENSIVDSRYDQYNSRGAYYGSNANSYEYNNNSMQRYQNEAEFQESEDEFP